MSQRSHFKIKEMLSFHNVFYLQYEGSIEENTYGVEVMRIKASDLDLKDTDNWKAEFDITKGNEAGYFSIRTDPKTNEGILMLDKVLAMFVPCSLRRNILDLLTSRSFVFFLHKYLKTVAWPS